MKIRFNQASKIHFGKSKPPEPKSGADLVPNESTCESLNQSPQNVYGRALIGLSSNIKEKYGITPYREKCEIINNLNIKNEKFSRQLLEFDEGGFQKFLKFYSIGFCADDSINFVKNPCTQESDEEIKKLGRICSLVKKSRLDPIVLRAMKDEEYLNEIENNEEFRKELIRIDDSKYTEQLTPETKFIQSKEAAKKAFSAFSEIMSEKDIENAAELAQNGMPHGVAFAMCQEGKYSDRKISKINEYLKAGIEANSAKKLVDDGVFLGPSATKAIAINKQGKAFNELENRLIREYYTYELLDEETMGPVSQLVEKGLPFTVSFETKNLDFENEDILEIFVELAKSASVYYYHDKENSIHEMAREIYYNKNKGGLDIESAKEIIKHETVAFSDEIVEEIREAYKQGFLSPVLIPPMLGYDLDLKEVIRASNILPKEKIRSWNEEERAVALTIIDLYNVDSIDEIPPDRRSILLQNLMTTNTDVFGAERLSDDFPLIPKNEEEYCKLVSSLAVKIGIKTKHVSKAQIKQAETSVTNLSQTLKNLSDEEFRALEIKQDYPKEDFIKDVLEALENLPAGERQKIYNHFGFEIVKNGNTKIGFSIKGYPINQNKEPKEIENQKTKEAAQEVGQMVTKFSEQNKITCSNKELEGDLNKIFKAFPELRTCIGRKQYGIHVFDITKHSLKVMQKIAQNEKFEQLNESDKKIMLLASIFHDITKTEETHDIAHPKEGALDTYYITQKMNLSKEESVKLFNLINSHEWLRLVNTSENENEKRLREMSVAYDLHHGNLFEMEDIFTDADLKGVCADDEFYNTLKEIKDLYSSEIKEYINTLKATQPILPATKLPSADRIKKEITTVNPDGSTNIKGVYVYKKGLVVIKYSEVEDFEKIGFQKGSTSKGTILKNPATGRKHETGNIKFLLHGLGSKGDLANFKSFSLPNSNAVISTTYTENPECGQRYFLPRGLILNSQTQNIHGGGSYDCGSGCKKTTDDFKSFIFEEDGITGVQRLFISNMIKEKLNLTDEEYKNFVEKNSNKSLCEIQPQKAQEILTKAFSDMQERTGNSLKDYNEVFVSNPEIGGCYLWDNRNIAGTKGVKTFLDKYKNDAEFLYEYAVKNNLPIVILNS